MPTQQEIAEHLCMSERNVRDVLQQIASRVGVDPSRPAWWQDVSMDLVRRGYIEHMRDVAGGRGGDAQGDLTRARTLDALASAELRQLQIAEKAGLLVPIDEIEPQLTAMVTAARQELLSLPDKLVGEIKALYGVDVDHALIEEKINDALSQLVTTLHKNSEDHDGESHAPLVAATEADDD